MVTTRSQSREASDPPSLSLPNGSKSPHKISAAESAGGPERPVRRQLRKTKIESEGENKSAIATDSPSSESGSLGTGSDKTSPARETKDRGRAKKKRSFDELEVDTTNTTDSKRAATASKQSRNRSKLKQPAHSDAAKSELLVESVETNDGPVEGASMQGDGHQNGIVDEGTLQTETSQPLKEIDEATTDLAADNESKRPATPPPDVLKPMPSDAMPMSPQNKRNREEFTNGQVVEPIAAVHDSDDKSNLTSEATSFAKESTPSMQEPEKKKSRDDSASTMEKPAVSSTKIPPGSAQSPFGAMSTKPLKPDEPQQPQTSTSAFASSGFASFASSTSSPFGAVPTSTTAKENGVSPKVEAAPTFASLSGSKSPFASTTATSAFGTSKSLGGGSGFGGLSTGFGGFGSKAPVTNWGTNGTSGIIGLSSKPAKPFGAPKDKDEEDEEDGEASEPEDNTIKVADEGSEDPRFYKQKVATGEEQEKCLFASRAKLYINDDSQWKERAVGSIKVNVEKDNPHNGTARFIMRADGSHRITLNSPITKDLHLRDPAGGPPTGKNALFMGFDNGKLRMMQLKMKNNVEMMKLYNAVQEVLHEPEEPEPSQTSQEEP